ncbi:MAG: DNA photolyase, partial [Pseudomonadota bacterium]
VADAAAAAGTRTVVVIAPPVGPGADAIATAKPLLENLGLEVVLVRRTEDTAAWPHADKGFFKMKKAIPKLMP